MAKGIGSADFSFPLPELNTPVEGELYVPLASQEVTVEQEEYAQQVADALKHPRE